MHNSHGSNWQTRAARWVLIALVGAVGSVRAEDIEGVQPASVDQPRVNVVLRRTARGDVLSSKSRDGEVFNVEAFLDTGASSILISTGTAGQLGVAREGANGHETQFEDVGVGGGSGFAVSEPLFLGIAPNTPGVETENKELIQSVYTQNVGPFRTEVGPLGAGANLMEALTGGGLDVVGMPAMAGKLVVMDLKDANEFTDKIRTRMFAAGPKGAAGPEIPKVSRHVKLSFANFKAFTKTTPPRDEEPAIAANPFIGPAPFSAAGVDRTPPVIVRERGKESSGSWLLDTGATASMISRRQAAAIGITYAQGTYETDHPKLDGVAADRQFVMTVGGIGGAKKSAGVYLDSLALQTREGKPLVFIKAPVLVADISMKDAAGKEFTLDGVFGMNFLVGSAKVEEGLLPDFGKLTPGAFRYIVFDQPNGILGLE